MPASPLLPPSPFSATERDLIRREFGPRFGQQPALAAGLFLRRWRSGPQAGQPKIPAAMQGLLDRGLLEIRAMGAQPRGLDPERFRHLRAELGLETAEPCRPALPVPA